MIDPTQDGIDHINVYAMGKTEFGRFFSNMADAPISLPYLGSFRTIEGLWHYLGNPDENYRTVTGFKVKEISKRYTEQQMLPEAVFQYIIRSAILKKAKKYGGLDLCKNPAYRDLPLKHYYVYGRDSTSPKVVDVTEKYQWWLDIIDWIRNTANDQN